MFLNCTIKCCIFVLFTIIISNLAGRHLSEYNYLIFLYKQIYKCLYSIVHYRIGLWLIN